MQQDREGIQKDSSAHAYPLPTPPPLAGEGADRVRRSRRGIICICVSPSASASASAFASASPPSRKGGATRASLPLERIPFHRNNVRGGLARRDRLGREIVDRDGRGQSVGGGTQPARPGPGEASLATCLLAG